ncbi:MAG TPA: glycosyltransferase [Kofleriaceae bacterium]|nr:glycosyltransferase [Kofleriaceae bacterium]
MREPIGYLRHFFLPPSETFIFTSMRSLTRYAPRVFAIARRAPDKHPWDDVTALKSLRFGWWESWLYRLTTWSPRYFRWARTVKLLHAHMGYTGVYGLWAAKKLELPLITSFYGHDVSIGVSRDRFNPDYWHYAALRRRLFRRGDRFLVLSKHMQAAMVAQGCPEEKIRVVPLGVNLARFDVRRPDTERNERSFRVLMVGREVEKKGFDDGLRACARAKEAGIDVKVTILGTDHPRKASLIALGKELGLDVAWPDPKSPVPDAMARADVLLVPSKTTASGEQEGTPTVICEGSAARLPIVATRHAGIPEQVEPGVTGLLADERDVDGLAAHLVALANDPARREAFGIAGRLKMEHEYSLEAHTARLEAVYDEVLR